MPGWLHISMVCTCILCVCVCVCVYQHAHKSMDCTYLYGVFVASDSKYLVC